MAEASDIRHMRASMPDTTIWSQRARLLLIGILIAAVALMGGSARPDVIALVVMRPIIVVLIAAIILLPGQTDWRSIRYPLIFLFLFALTMAIQLIPLPIGMWQALSGHQRLDVAPLLPDGANAWLTISLYPDATWNSMLALLPAGAALVGYASLTPDRRVFFVEAMIVLVLLCAVLGILQTLGGKDSFFYPYRYMHRGMPTGFFANRNHTAALLALSLPLLRVWPMLPARSPEVARARSAVAVCLGILFILVALVTGSRSGLILMVIGLAGAALAQPITRPRSGVRNPALITLLAFGAIAAIVAFAILLGRAESIDRLMGIDIEQNELRVKNMPELIATAKAFLPLGSGFGSFEPVFRSFESSDLLHYAYFNNAHNDLLELTITGGIPALLVLAGFTFWWAWNGVRAFLKPANSIYSALRRVGAVGILILFVASLTDYPLRTPLMALVFALLAAWLQSSSAKSPASRREAHALGA